ncbi:unnamed protein product [Prorocentrum cordatum]|uniref:Uncharacterized protein n=1 Tax=Prorocentrum cordatum TaxID=2364126 RepID=A0ABN9TKT7_9DINO|nr:unnamed protein product [Polarella glacialis]
MDGGLQVMCDLCGGTKDQSWWNFCKHCKGPRVPVEKATARTLRPVRGDRSLAGLLKPPWRQPGAGGQQAAAAGSAAERVASGGSSGRGGALRVSFDLATEPVRQETEAEEEHLAKPVELLTLAGDTVAADNCRDKREENRLAKQDSDIWVELAKEQGVQAEERLRQTFDMCERVEQLLVDAQAEVERDTKTLDEARAKYQSAAHSLHTIVTDPGHEARGHPKLDRSKILDGAELVLANGGFFGLEQLCDVAGDEDRREAARRHRFCSSRLYTCRPATSVPRPRRSSRRRRPRPSGLQRRGPARRPPRPRRPRPMALQQKAKPQSTRPNPRLWPPAPPSRRRRPRSTPRRVLRTTVRRYRRGGSSTKHNLSSRDRYPVLRAAPSSAWWMRSPSFEYGWAAGGWDGAFEDHGPRCSQASHSTTERVPEQGADQVMGGYNYEPGRGYGTADIYNGEVELLRGWITNPEPEGEPPPTESPGRRRGGGGARTSRARRGQVEAQARRRSHLPDGREGAADVRAEGGPPRQPPAPWAPQALPASRRPGAAEPGAPSPRARHVHGVQRAGPQACSRRGATVAVIKGSRLNGLWFDVAGLLRPVKGMASAVSSRQHVLESEFDELARCKPSRGAARLPVHGFVLNLRGLGWSFGISRSLWSETGVSIDRFALAPMQVGWLAQRALRLRSDNVTPQARPGSQGWSRAACQVEASPAFPGWGRRRPRVPRPPGNHTGNTF